jgi:hypothetical protein
MNVLSKWRLSEGEVGAGYSVEVSGQLHAPYDLHLEEKLPLSIG